MSETALASVAALPKRRVEDGYVDFYGHAAAAGGWLFCGWSRVRWEGRLKGGAVVAHFERGRMLAETLVCWHPRADLGAGGNGLVVFVRAGERALGELIGLEVELGGRLLRLPSVRPVVHLREADLVARVRSILHGATGGYRVRLLALLSRRAYAGADTIAELPVPVQFEVDETLLLPPHGLALAGWMLDPTEAVAAVRVRRGAAVSPPLAARLLRTRRPDVFESVGARLGLPHDRCGFLAVAPEVMAERAGPIYVEIELTTGEIGFKRLPGPVRSGVGAIRRLLDGIELAADQLDDAFDRVLGPALTALNRARLQRPRLPAELVFGTPPAAPECSVIVPLYGRMDFLAYQLALLSAHPGMARHELIYVLDDPPRRRELVDLAHSAHRRFGLPFRLLLLEENLGYGPANNVGLAAARGEFVCYLNSDVFPAEPRWLELMIEDLRADPGLGLVGALLLFEDGTVQHEGIAFERLPQFAGWPFPLHPRKGRLPRGEAGLVEVAAATGACLVLRQALAAELGGFDEAYAIGDFEDTDLCHRVAARGLRIAVDHRARLWHLERQSQVTPDKLWRFHVTLFNAWTHTRRWYPT
jgi:GT2 family glycosyltransferase